MKKISKIVCERRKAFGLSQSYLAKKTGMRQATISDFETGKHAIGSDTLDLIFQVLEIKLSYKPSHKTTLKFCGS